MIFVIDDDAVMAECIKRACGEGADVLCFGNAIEAMAVMDESAEELPELIFLDILLDGPDGFTFLNELASYTDTAKIPVVIVTSLDLRERDLASYGVVGVLEKDKMVPQEIKEYVREYVTK